MSCIIKSVFTVSELKVAWCCMTMHSYRYGHNLTSTRVGLGDLDDVEFCLIPAARGTVIHQLLAFHEPEWPDAEIRRRLEVGLLKEVPALDWEVWRGNTRAEQILSAAVSNMFADVARFRTSELHTRMRASSEVHREYPFFLRLYDDTYVKGKIDLLVRDELGRWTIVDYKTDKAPPPLDLRDHNRIHTLQMSLYAAALSDLNEQTLPSEVNLFRTATGRSLTFKPTRDWLDEGLMIAENLIDQMRQPPFSVPVRPSPWCDGCIYHRLCQEDG